MVIILGLLIGLGLAVLAVSAGALIANVIDNRNRRNVDRYMASVIREGARRARTRA